MTKAAKPFYWLNEVSRLFLSRDYLRDGIEPEQRYRAIADRAEEILQIKGFADKFYDYVGRGYYSISTPVTTNFGYDHGLPISCNGSFIEDTMESILHKNGEVGIMSKYGAGTSGYFGALRPRGSSIKNNGKSSGAVHFMKLFDTVADLVSQGASRRGSFAAYLPVEHEDIHEFLTIRDESHAIQNMSIGVTITNAWMRDLVDGDKEKRKIWGKIIEKRFATGYPYIMFVDNANDSAPQVYKDKSKKIYASNLCVTGDTLIDIRIGESEYRTIKISDLEFHRKSDQTVFVKSRDINTNQDVYSEITDFAQTGQSSEIIEIEDESGNIIKCTPEHKILTKNRGYIEAQFLEETDILVNSDK